MSRLEAGCNTVRRKIRFALDANVNQCDAVSPKTAERGLEKLGSCQVLRDIFADKSIDDQRVAPFPGFLQESQSIRNVARDSGRQTEVAFCHGERNGIDV